MNIEYEFKATRAIYYALSDGRLVDSYAPKCTQMMERLRKLKRANPALRNVVCTVNGMMENDVHTMCNLMDFQYHAKAPSVAAQQDLGDVLIPTAAANANAIAADDEITYNFCHGAFMMLLEALRRKAEDRHIAIFDEDVIAEMSRER